MSNVKKLMMTAAAGGGLSVEDVFDTFLWLGQGSFSNTNNIDMSTEGGSVWLKNRTYTAGRDWRCFSTGLTSLGYHLTQNATYGEQNLGSAGIQSYNTDGWTLGSGNSETNASGWGEYAAWTFRKAPKFYDVVTWTGNGVNGRTISHNLGSVPGMIMVKRVNGSEDWTIYHRGLAAADYIRLDENAKQTGGAKYRFGDGTNAIAPTSTEFTVASYSAVNSSGNTYIAFLFAHNDGDGDFGPTGDQDIIKCDSYNSQATVNLGWEPQWVLLKNSTSGSTRWLIFDNMRGVGVGDADYGLTVSRNEDELGSQNWIEFTPTGFKITNSNGNVSGTGIIYVAIRRGPMRTPESATDVFDMDFGNNAGSSTDSEFKSNFPVDMGIYKSTSGGAGVLEARTHDTKRLYTAYNDSYGNMVRQFDFSDGFHGDNKPSSNLAYMWKRAPGYFDISHFTATTNANRRINHQLGVVPEMVWVKNTTRARNWYVYHKDMDTSPRNWKQHLNLANSASQTFGIWGTSDPTTTDFGINENDVVGFNGDNVNCYFFATLNGVSKVGGYTGNGGTQNIDCGFSSGARFILLKGVDLAINWYIFDTERGIVAGNDPEYYMDNTSAQGTSRDLIDPYNPGFTLTGNGPINNNGVKYIYYAIA